MDREVSLSKIKIFLSFTCTFPLFQKDSNNGQKASSKIRQKYKVHNSHFLNQKKLCLAPLTFFFSAKSRDNIQLKKKKRKEKTSIISLRQHFLCSPVRCCYVELTRPLPYVETAALRAIYSSWSKCQLNTDLHNIYIHSNYKNEKNEQYYTKWMNIGTTNDCLHETIIKCKSLKI